MSSISESPLDVKEPFISMNNDLFANYIHIQINVCIVVKMVAYDKLRVDVDFALRCHTSKYVTSGLNGK